MLVALTGGIGAGKSTVARLLAAHGAAIVDADLIARGIVDPGGPSTGPVLAELRALLGDGVFAADGTLDRQAVASIVFGDQATLTAYNAILRSALITATSAAITSALAAASGTPVVHEIPLLNSHSSPLPWTYDAVVTVEAPTEERLLRLINDRGYTPEEARARVVAQGTEESRTELADVVLRNDGPRDQLEALVTSLWTSWGGDNRAPGFGRTSPAAPPS
jgi:dephospho-CoA kinase